MKTSVKLLVLIPFIISLYACPSPYTEEKFVKTKKTKLKYNLIGVVGESSGTPYIEVEYSEDNGNGENKVVKKMLSPPFLIGGHFVNVLYDSMNFISNTQNQILYSYRLLKPNYTKGGSNYLKIKNYSNKPLEYFIAGTQDVVTISNPLNRFNEPWLKKKYSADNTCDWHNGIQVIPTPFYNKAPIYYLLFPQKKHTTNLFKIELIGEESSNVWKYTCETFYFSDNKCGDLTLNKEWSVEEVMTLYRAEYKNSNEIKLYADYWNAYIYGYRLNSKNGLPGNWEYARVNKKLYGTIAPNDSLVGNEKIWITNTPRFYDKEF